MTENRHDVTLTVRLNQEIIQIGMNGFDLHFVHCGQFLRFFQADGRQIHRGYIKTL